MKFVGEDIFRLIPQRNPFVMVDEFETTGESTAQTALYVRTDNFFILPDGTLNRKLVAQIAFSTPEKTAVLNAITHPKIAQLMLKEAQSCDGDAVIFDAPQLFESGLDVLCDLTVAVTAPRDERLRRIRERDGLSGQDALRRIGVQFTDGFFAEKCDFVIENSSTLTALAARVGEIILRI